MAITLLFIHKMLHKLCFHKVKQYSVFKSEKEDSFSNQTILKKAITQGAWQAVKQH